MKEIFPPNSDTRIFVSDINKVFNSYAFDTILGRVYLEHSQHGYYFSNNYTLTKDHKYFTNPEIAVDFLVGKCNTYWERIKFYVE